MIPGNTVQRRNRLNHFLFLRREPLEPKLRPSNASAGNGSQNAQKVFDLCCAWAEAATVVKVMVAVPPLLPTVTGMVLPNEQAACEGVNVTVALTAHERVTAPVYPFAEVAVTVVCTLPPGLMVAEVTPGVSE